MALGSKSQRYRDPCNDRPRDLTCWHDCAAGTEVPVSRPITGDDADRCGRWRVGDAGDLLWLFPADRNSVSRLQTRRADTEARSQCNKLVGIKKTTDEFGELLPTILIGKNRVHDEFNEFRESKRLGQAKSIFRPAFPSSTAFRMHYHYADGNRCPR